MDSEPHLREHATHETSAAESRARLESVSIRGFRSLADVHLSGLGDVTVLIGANGSGKSNAMRFFEMLSWMSTAADQPMPLASTARPLVVAAKRMPTTAW